MSKTAIMGRGVVLRGGFSLYLSIDEDWMQDAGLEVSDTCRLGVGEIGEASMTIQLWIDQDYEDVDAAPGKFDVEPVDIVTDVQWCLPCDIRREYGITGEFAYNAEYLGDGEILYELVSPTARDDRLLA